MRNICYIFAAAIAFFAFTNAAAAQQAPGVVEVSAEKKAAGQALQLAPSTEAAPKLKRVNRPDADAAQADQAEQRRVRKATGAPSEATSQQDLPWGENSDVAAYEAAKLAWIETHADAYRSMVQQ